jgi:hypothetical protein
MLVEVDHRVVLVDGRNRAGTVLRLRYPVTNGVGTH